MSNIGKISGKYNKYCYIDWYNIDNILFIYVDKQNI